MLIRLTLFLIVTSFVVGCRLSAASPPGEIANSFARVKLTAASGVQSPIPLNNQLTIVNLFDEFSLGCPTGNRFETLERFHSLQPDAPLLLIFSGNHFSSQDIDNFKAILPIPESLVQGDIEAVRPNLISGKLLVVLDAKGNVIWHETAGMSEEQVVSKVGELIHSASK